MVTQNYFKSRFRTHFLLASLALLIVMLTTAACGGGGAQSDAVQVSAQAGGTVTSNYWGQVMGMMKKYRRKLPMASSIMPSWKSLSSALISRR